MSAKVMTVTSGKGGVGKTTATANIGVALALLGQKVVCIDSDIGLRNLDAPMELENRIVCDPADMDPTTVPVHLSSKGRVRHLKADIPLPGPSRRKRNL
jgi:septum formation inhibitor-activating ATPase MinD